MIWDINNGKGKKVLDEKGTELNYVTSFDDQTGMISFILAGKDGKPIISNGDFLRITAKIPGAIIVDVDPKATEYPAGYGL